MLNYSHVYYISVLTEKKQNYNFFFLTTDIKFSKLIVKYNCYV